MGTRQSTTAVPTAVTAGHHSNHGRTSAGVVHESSDGGVHLQQGHLHQGAASSSSSQSAAVRYRAISLGGAATATSHRGFPVSIPASNGGSTGGVGEGGGRPGSPDSDDSTPDEHPLSRAILGSSLPVHLFSFRDIKCPVCSKLVPADDVEIHFVMCLTRPKINYNEDVLLEDKDECVICFEELHQGDTIARLPCLCIYHKSCIDQWFKVKRSCPEHPND